MNIILVILHNKEFQLLFLSIPFFCRSDSEDEDNISTKAVIKEVVHDVEGEEAESGDVLGPLPNVHWIAL